MVKSFTLGEFLKKYKTDRDCLLEIISILYPDGVTCKKCQKITKHYLLKTRPALSCMVCHSQIYPLKNTIFYKSTTPLKLWFYAMFCMIHSKGGISAKGLQRQLGITYKTAWRMLHQVRKLMADNSGEKLTGTVEIDETWMGGKSWRKGKQWWDNWKEIPQTTVMGFVERGGRARTVILEDTYRITMVNKVHENVDLSAHVMTDYHSGYQTLRKYGYKHDAVNHSVQYVDSFDKNIHTNTIEGFWSQLKRGIIGTYRHVSPKYLQAYCDEFTFRHSNRNRQAQVFCTLLAHIEAKKALNVNLTVPYISGNVEGEKA